MERKIRTVSLGSGSFWLGQEPLDGQKLVSSDVNLVILLE